ncbi:hypothetical protein BGX33_002611, partial [Mortierella sp. NVP41]
CYKYHPTATRDHLASGQHRTEEHHRGNSELQDNSLTGYNRDNTGYHQHNSTGMHWTATGQLREQLHNSTTDSAFNTADATNTTGTANTTDAADGFSWAPRTSNTL